jgi:hypothetical protein
MPTFRTVEHRTDRILKDWILKERLAFNLEPSLSVSELQAILPPRCKEQLGDFKPTDNVFRKMSQGFNRVSDVWIELMRFIGVSDFSPEQAILGTVSTFLDSENVRVKLNTSYDAPHRKNSIEVLCLNEPTHQGLIRYEGDRLSFPPSIFEAVIDRRLSVYSLYCENLKDLLLIPSVSDPQSLLIAENNARLAEEPRGLGEQSELDAVSAEDPWMDSPERTIEGIYKSDGSAIYEAEPSHDDVQEHIELIGSLMTDDAKTSDDAIALTPFDAVENDSDVQNQTLAEAIEDSVNGHGNLIDDDVEYDAAELEAEIEEAAQDILREADFRDRNQLMAGSDDEETSDDAIALTPYDDVVNDPKTTPFGGAVNPRVYHMIPFDERVAKNAARTTASEIEVESVDYTDEDTEIEAAVDGHGSEINEVDGEIEDFDEDWDGTGSTF